MLASRAYRRSSSAMVESTFMKLQSRHASTVERRRGGRAVIAGCARNCAAHLPAVLANIARAAELFTETAFVFVENDSHDETADILATFARNNPRVYLERATGLA